MNMQKLEIVIPDSFLEDLVHALDDAGAPGYTALEISRGKGKKFGETLIAGLLPVTRSTYIFTLCKQEIITKAVMLIDPIIEEVGGIYTVTNVALVGGTKIN